TGVRIDFGIPTSNQFGVGTVWTDSGANPITDIDNVIGAARNKGYSLKFIWMDKVTYNAFKANTNVVAAYAGFLHLQTAQVFRIKREELDSFLAEEYGLTLIVIDKVSQIEKGGAKVAVE